MLRALGIVTDNIDSGRQIGIAADRYCGRSVLRQIGTAADRYCSRTVLQQICAAAWQCTERQEERDEP